jgi:hypothetical protein
MTRSFPSPSPWTNSTSPPKLSSNPPFLCEFKHACDNSCSLSIDGSGRKLRCWGLLGSEIRRIIRDRAFEEKILKFEVASKRFFGFQVKGQK